MKYETRDEFVKIIDDKGYKTCVEVGVREGHFSERILRESSGKLWGIDINTCHKAPKLQSMFPGRYEFLVARSPQCAKDFNDESFDFIHIDADHSYAGCKADLEGWWPKVSKGGVFSGDDFADVNNPHEGKYGVVEAVLEVVDKYGLQLHVTGVEDDREKQLQFAKYNGEQAGNYLRNQYHNKFIIPCWYVFKD